MFFPPFIPNQSSIISTMKIIYFHLDISYYTNYRWFFHVAQTTHFSRSGVQPGRQCHFDRHRRSGLCLGLRSTARGSAGDGVGGHWATGAGTGERLTEIYPVKPGGSIEKNVENLWFSQENDVENLEKRWSNKKKTSVNEFPTSRFVCRRVPRHGKYPIFVSHLNAHLVHLATDAKFGHFNWRFSIKCVKESGWIICKWGLKRRKWNVEKKGFKKANESCQGYSDPKSNGIPKGPCNRRPVARGGQRIAQGLGWWNSWRTKKKAAERAS